MKPIKLKLLAAGLALAAGGCATDPWVHHIVQADVRHGHDRYLLIDDAEPSRPGGDGNGYCGAGIEGYLVWQHLHDGAVVAKQSVQYESCFGNIEGSPPVWSGHIFTLAFVRFIASTNTGDYTIVHSTAAFDTRMPERGLLVTATNEMVTAKQVPAK
jgi:hypothetical protein